MIAIQRASFPPPFPPELVVAEGTTAGAYYVDFLKVRYARSEREISRVDDGLIDR